MKTIVVVGREGMETEVQVGTSKDLLRLRSLLTRDLEIAETEYARLCGMLKENRELYLRTYNHEDKGSQMHSDQLKILTELLNSLKLSTVAAKAEVDRAREQLKKLDSVKVSWLTRKVS